MPTSNNLLNNITFSLIKPFNNQNIYKEKLFTLIFSDYYCLGANCPSHGEESSRWRIVYGWTVLVANHPESKTTRTGGKMSRGQTVKVAKMSINYSNNITPIKEWQQWHELQHTKEESTSSTCWSCTNNCYLKVTWCFLNKTKIHSENATCKC